MTDPRRQPACTRALAAFSGPAGGMIAARRRKLPTGRLCVPDAFRANDNSGVDFEMRLSLSTSRKPRLTTRIAGPVCGGSQGLRFDRNNMALAWF